MKVSLIVAVDRAWGIGKENRVPWHLSSDLKNFKSITMGHHLIMGRKTYDSIGKSLPGRTTIVISRNPHLEIENTYIVGSIQEALELAEDRGDDEAFIIGGGEIFEVSLHYADRIYLTRVDATYDCDVFFPEIDLSSWVKVEGFSQDHNEDNQHSFIFNIYERSLT